MSSTTTLQDGIASVRFETPFSLEDYPLFLKTKALPEFKLSFDGESDSYTITTPERFAHLLGLHAQAYTASELEISPFLFDYQAWITRQAVVARRFALWEDCGLGKTLQALEWARHIRNGGRVLFSAPNKIIHQWQDEATKFFGDTIPLQRLNSRDEIKAWCQHGVMPDGSPGGYAITNHEKFIAGVIEECRYLRAFVLDESSILKSGMGKIKRSICESSKGIEYKLSLSATPAPNDTTEYVTQAEFLESGGREMLAEFFYRNYDGATWILRPHAKDAFYRFMASWSIYLRKPSAYGFKDQYNLPEPKIIEERVPMSDEQLKLSRKYGAVTGGLFNDEKIGVKARSKLSQLAKGFIYQEGDAESKEGKRLPVRVKSAKPRIVCDRVREWLKEGRQCLVWTVFDEESEILSEMLAGIDGVATLHGKNSDEECDQILEDFRLGKVRCLISKAKLLGYGMNFQFCTRMAFSGFDDSFEMFYQAIRRAHRYGQSERVVIFVPYIFELESHMWNNLLRKKSQWESDIATQEANYVAALKAA